MKKCPKCNRKYIDFDLFCSSCNVNLVYDEPVASSVTVASAPVVKKSAPVNPAPVNPVPVNPAPVNTVPVTPAPVNNTAAPEKKKGLLWWQILIIVAVSVILLIAIVISAVTIIDNLDESDGYQQAEDEDDDDEDDNVIEDGEDAGDDNNVNGGNDEYPVIDNNNTGDSEFTTSTEIPTQNVENTTSYNPNSGNSGNSGTPNVENTTSYNPNSGNSGNSGAVNSSDYSVILSKYTSVMNQLKSGVSSYNKIEWQELGDDYNLGTVGNLVLPIAQGMMTSYEDAEIQNRNDMAQIPVIRNAKGCLLTDTSKIKSASMTQSGSKTTITIVLKDEQNPYPAEEGATYCGSAVGSMFNPLNQAEVDNIIAQFSGVMTINKFLITAKDCTATLVFDTATGKVESLTQVMNYHIDVDAKAVIVPVSGYAMLKNTVVIDNITY